MKLFDCFSFYNEIKMLRFRLSELYDTVDYFILVEATKSHTNQVKPLYFERDKFKEFSDKIIHVIVEDIDSDDPWVNENKQRDAIGIGLSSIKPELNDLIIITDVDEIPDIDTLNNLKATNFSGVSSMEQDLYYYNLNCKYRGKWFHSKVCDYETFLRIGSANKIRDAWNQIPVEVIKNGGWHFSYFGSVESIIDKLNNFAHQEFRSFATEENITDAIKNNKDPFNRANAGFEYISLEENKYLPKKFKLLL